VSIEHPLGLPHPLIKIRGTRSSRSCPHQNDRPRPPTHTDRHVMRLDIDVLLSELTLAEKASLTSGSGFWYTAAVPRLGVPKIMVSDGPHGLRAQPAEGDQSG
jgi:hypothetical protein